MYRLCWCRCLWRCYSRCALCRTLNRYRLWYTLNRCWLWLYWGWLWYTLNRCWRRCTNYRRCLIGWLRWINGRGDRCPLDRLCRLWHRGCTWCLIRDCSHWRTLHRWKRLLCWHLWGCRWCEWVSSWISLHRSELYRWNRWLCHRCNRFRLWCPFGEEA